MTRFGLRIPLARLTVSRFLISCQEEGDTLSSTITCVAPVTTEVMASRILQYQNAAAVQWRDEMLLHERQEMTDAKVTAP